MGYRVAVVGATGAVGSELLNTLAGRDFPADEVVALASAKSVGREVSFGDDAVLTVGDLEFDFAGADIALFSPGAKVSAVHAPRAAKAGCIVIDNTSRFRMDDDVPLVVPEVNPEAIAGYAARNIIANPNCSTIQMVVALKPLHDLATIERVVVATYQSVSGAGRAAMDELFDQTKGVYVHKEKTPERLPRRIAFNVIPHIDVFMPSGETREEWKMAQETKKILDAHIEVIATCVRVPVFIGHAEAVHLEFERPIREDEAREALRRAPGVVVVDDPGEDGYVTPAECVGEDAVFVSRIRKDPTVLNGLALWVVSDNLLKGAALNAVQIAECLVADYLEPAQRAAG
ncbi:MAG: aspartate-semialdehyde dehydrogenase [Proteobacteria bacterium]|nr:aspartate-semialdehyde dehydrogenase [Pseudomonadota bacterium]